MMPCSHLVVSLVLVALLVSTSKVKTEQGKDRARLFAREQKTGRGHEIESTRKAKIKQDNVCESKRAHARQKQRKTMCARAREHT